MRSKTKNSYFMIKSLKGGAGPGGAGPGGGAAGPGGGAAGPGGGAGQVCSRACVNSHFNYH